MHGNAWKCLEMHGQSTLFDSLPVEISIGQSSLFDRPGPRVRVYCSLFRVSWIFWRVRVSWVGGGKRNVLKKNKVYSKKIKKTQIK